MDDGVKIGLLGIELPTRRRNRMNGVVSASGKDGFSVRVDQSFGNCPKYIQTRDIQLTGDRNADQPGTIVSGATISTEAKALIERVDTFFIASRTKHINDDPRSGIDVSHRGGRRGFVQVVNNSRISFPDFAGNRIFNTLGNIVDDGRVGIIFADFASGDAVLVSGRASVIWDKQRVSAFRGAERLIDVAVEKTVFAPAILPVSGELIEAWPDLAKTGAWVPD